MVRAHGLIIDSTTVAAILFKAQLVNQQGELVTELSRILFGVDSLPHKEESFRALCQQKFPHLHILEPLEVKPAPGRE